MFYSVKRSLSSSSCRLFCEQFSWPTVVKKPSQPEEIVKIYKKQYWEFCEPRPTKQKAEKILQRQAAYRAKNRSKLREYYRSRRKQFHQFYLNKRAKVRSEFQQQIALSTELKEDLERRFNISEPSDWYKIGVVEFKAEKRFKYLLKAFRLIDLLKVVMTSTKVGKK
eukprot:TRINITY_DN3929_c0_g2_i1.p1 TRINITY_DN3929_c0_g2~~TRINITY_DN3929_c0_g2_i1.p1  ORF type:complete len:186 (-),score=35.74 TRINITY_DN3929_c0_g2_i1:780-1280(-)